jgi:hypothetical protein
MTFIDEFSPVEWSVLTDIPVRVIACAITADPSSGVGAILEEVTGLTQLAHGAMQRPESELVQAVFASFKENGAGEERTLLLSQQAIDNLLPETILLARDVATLLAGRIDTDEALAYTSWLLETAESVCAAAKSGGGILGIGGKRISDAEQQFLRELEAALSLANVGPNG